MPRRASFAEVSRNVTKTKNDKSPMRKQNSDVSGKLKRRKTVNSFGSGGKNSTPRPKLGEVNEAVEQTPQAVPEEGEALEQEPQPQGEGEEVVAVEGGEEQAEVVVLGEAPGGEDGEDGERDDKEDEEEEDERKAEAEAVKRPGRPRRLTKKQLRLQQERLEEEQEREERRKRREERRRRKELAAEKAAAEAADTFDEAAFKESIYTLVKSSLGLVMNQCDLNITVDNLTPLMKGLELDTGDENVKDLILAALLDSYGIVDPKTIDDLVIQKEVEKDLHELEDCVDTAFAIIDQDRDGIITHNDIYLLMIRLGEVLFDNQVAAILDAADVDGDGKISKKDLFLFLLGHEKTVKLEDQILNKYGQDDTSADNPAPPEDKAAEPASNSTDTPATQASPEVKAQDEPAPGTPLSGTLKSVAPAEDSIAKNQRRSMFAGYSRMVIAANRFANSGNLEKDAEEATAKSPQSEAQTEDIVKDCSPEKDDSEAQKEITTMDDDEIEKEDDDETGNKDNNGESAGGENEIVNENAAYSDSGHVGSERDDDMDDDDDDEMQFDAGPLALDSAICYLPAPEFSVCGSPRTPRSAGSNTPRATPRLRSYESLADDPSPESPIEAVTSTERQEAQHAFSHHVDRLVRADVAIHTHDAGETCMERTSEYDSEREGDSEDSLPETSQQTLIMKEIEKQVLQTKEALAVKPQSPNAAALMQRLQANLTNPDPGDGCESVVESVIHPVYVPPCAREALGGIKLPSLTFRGDGEDLQEVGVNGAPFGEGRKGWGKEREERRRLDALTVDNYGTSAAENVSKSYVSMSTPRSFSTLTTKSPGNNDDVFSPEPEEMPSAAYPHASDYQGHFGFGRADINEFRDVLRASENAGQNKQVGLEGEGYVADAREASPQRDILVDGVPEHLRLTCDRAQKLPARRRANAPLRRSLTCHMITVKDLSSAFHNSQSPTRNTHAMLTRRKSSMALNSLSHPRHDSPSSRRESSVGRKQSSLTRIDSFLSRRDASLSRKDCLSSPAHSPARRGRQSLAPRNCSPSGRMDSPSGRGESGVARVYSPVAGLDAYHLHGLESTTNTARDSSRSQKASTRTATARDSAYGDSWRSSRKDSVFVQSDLHTLITEEHTDEPYCEDDAESGVAEEEFKFYGPNFDIIMSQKGEPEELLKESLLRDAFVRSGERFPTARDIRLNSRGEDDTCNYGENRKARISRQLEKVKEMEALLMQRREKMATDSSPQDEVMPRSPKSARASSARDRRHTLHRSKTSADMNVNDLIQRHDFELADSELPHNDVRMYRSRPKSCIAGSRNALNSSNNNNAPPKVVTIADAEDEEWQVPSVRALRARASSASPCRRSLRAAVGEGETREKPKIHVVDLSTLLSDVNEPDPTDGDVDPTGEEEGGGKAKHRGKSFKPLARMLEAYERSRRRQAASRLKGSAATSISRQLEQGIPYRPPSPPHDRGVVVGVGIGGGGGDRSGGSRRGRETEVAARAEPAAAVLGPLPDSKSIDIVRSWQGITPTRTQLQRNRSFVLSNNSQQARGADPQPEEGDEELSPLLRDFLSHNPRGQLSGQNCDRGERLLMRNERDERDAKSSSVTLEFPERSVCVLRPKPAAPPVHSGGR